MGGDRGCGAGLVHPPFRATHTRSATPGAHVGCAATRLRRSAELQQGVSYPRAWATCQTRLT